MNTFVKCEIQILISESSHGLHGVNPAFFDRKIFNIVMVASTNLQ
jgi:hypothetical protein